MKVLIIHKPLNESGGIGSLFASLKKHFPPGIVHFEIGSRENENILTMLYRFTRDNINYLINVRKIKPDIVHINLSFNFKSVIRDGIFLLLSRSQSKKIIVYIHGWNESFEAKLTGYKKKIFLKVFGMCDQFIVLDRKREMTLIDWGFKQPIKIQVTAVDNDLLNQLDIHTTIKRRLSFPTLKILFLSRIIKEKGVYETLDSYSLLRSHEQLPVELIFAGDGPELLKCKEYVKRYNIPDVTFTGYIRGEKKRECLTDAFVYIFPSYAEGMPISVLEAMAFGLPVVTRCVGGLNDFFENGKHGYITDSYSPKQFAQSLKKLTDDKVLYTQISIYNYEYAQKHFLASKVANELVDVYNSLLL